MTPEIYLSNNYITLDLETTNLKYGSAQEKNNKLLMSVYSKNGVIKSTVANEYKQSELTAAVEQADFIVAQNAKFELKWLSRMGVDISKLVVWDTMIAEYVLYGNIRVPLGLGEIAQRYGYPGKDPYVDICMKKGICPSELPEELVLKRCQYDVRVTEGVFKQQLARLQEQGKLAVMMTRCILTPVLADIESNGMFLDEVRVKQEYFSVLERYEIVCQELNDLTGGINYKSPKQVGEYLYDVLEFDELKDRRGNVKRTTKGGRLTSAETIANLKPRNKTQRKFLELMAERGKLSAALDKSLAKFYSCCEKNDMLYAQFNQCVTRTHRLSSSGTDYKVQFQNLAREYKPLFTARNEGWLMGEVDGAQLEFRVAAQLGQDKQATEDIRNGVDVHAYTSETITAHGQDTDRQEAKAHTFKPLYGGMSGTKAEMAYYEAFKNKYSGIASTQQQWIDEVLRYKKLRTCTGLEFFWDDTSMTRMGFVTNSQSICNYPVQSLATADIIPIALYYFWTALKENNLKSFIVNTVHDSVILEIHPEEIDKVREIAIDSFTEKVYNYLSAVYCINFTVPLGVGIKFGTHWSEGEEEKINIEPTQ